MATKLTGRYVEFELFTLNFNEYLAMKDFYQKPISEAVHEQVTKRIANVARVLSGQFGDN